MDNFNLATALREYRKRERITQEEAATRLSMSQSAYSRHESGEVKPPYDRVQQIINTLQLEVVTAPLPMEEKPAALANKESDIQRVQKLYGRNLSLKITLILIILILNIPIDDIANGFGTGEYDQTLDPDPPYIALSLMGLIVVGLLYGFYRLVRGMLKRKAGSRKQKA